MRPSPVRVQLYKERLGNIPLPPLPVVTRWGTWLEAAFFYEEHFEEIKSLITELTDSTSAALEECKRLVQLPNLPQNLAYISLNFKFIVEDIKKLEKQNLTLCESVDLINHVKESLSMVKGNVGISVRNKFKYVLNKNSGFSILEKVVKVHQGDLVPDLELLPSNINNFKNAPITSVDVERSFSIYKYLYTDRKHNILIENFEKQIIVNCFDNDSL